MKKLAKKLPKIQLGYSYTAELLKNAMNYKAWTWANSQYCFFRITQKSLIITPEYVQHFTDQSNIAALEEYNTDEGADLKSYTIADSLNFLKTMSQWSFAFKSDTDYRYCYDAIDSKLVKDWFTAGLIALETYCGQAYSSDHHMFKVEMPTEDDPSLYHSWLELNIAENSDSAVVSFHSQTTEDGKVESRFIPVSVPRDQLMVMFREALTEFNKLETAQ